MSDCEGEVDVGNAQEITGWALKPGSPHDRLSVDISVNGQVIATVRACLHRPDLADRGVSDGYSGFHFRPTRYLDRPGNVVEVCFSGTGQVVTNGRFTLLSCNDPDANGSPDDLALVAEISKERWRGTESAEALTWGRLMTGDAFIDAVLGSGSLSNSARICELGPGYGRLLSTLLERDVPFREFVGIDLSEGRVTQLREEFAGDSRLRFEVGDINDLHLGQPADLVLCAGTFEHLYPDCSRALASIAANTSADGRVCIDFPRLESDREQGRQWFEMESKTFIRIYSEQELEELFAAAGFTDLHLRPLPVGSGARGAVERIFASVRPAARQAAPGQGANGSSDAV